MSIAYLFLGSDRVWYHDGDEKIFFDRNTLDSELPSALLHAVKKKKIKEIVVITGPGGFTNLRVGSLVCNLLAHYLPDIVFRVVSKIDCYKRCATHNIIPAIGLIYIGQQKSVWKYDCTTDEHTLVPKDVVCDGEYFIEHIDNYYEHNNSNAVTYEVIDGVMHIVFGGKSYALTELLAMIPLSHHVVPSYYVQPIIGEHKKIA